MGTICLSSSVCWAALCLQPVENVVHEQVDLIEINHYYDQRGKLVLEQIIYYDWSPDEARFQVRDWRLLKSPDQRPRRNWRRDEFVAVWRDRRQGNVLRKVRTRAVRETWTLYDPEVAEREFLATDRRKRLRGPLALAARSGDALLRR